MYDLRLHIRQSTTNQSENIPWRESLRTQWGIDQGAHDSSIRSFGSQGLRQWRKDWLRGANECRMMWLTVLFDIYIYVYLCYIHMLYVFFLEKLHKHIHVCVCLASICWVHSSISQFTLVWYFHIFLTIVSTSEVAWLHGTGAHS